MELGEPDASRPPQPQAGPRLGVPRSRATSSSPPSARARRSPTCVDGKVPNFLPLGESLSLTRWQTVQVNEKTFETTVEGVFSGGDVVTGAATAIEAIAAGRKAAYAIDTLPARGQGASPSPRSSSAARTPSPRSTVNDLRSQDAEAEAHHAAHPRGRAREGLRRGRAGLLAARPAARRRRAASSAAAWRCSTATCGSTPPSTASTCKHFLGEARQHQRDTTHPLIELDPNKCILCGRCVRICSDVVGVSAYGFINRGLRHRGGAGARRIAARHRLRVVRPVHRHLPDRRDRAAAAAGQARALEDRDDRRASATTAASAAGSTTTAYGDTLVKVSRNEANEVTFGNHCRKGRFGFNYVHAHDRLLAGACATTASGRTTRRWTRRSRTRRPRLKELSRRYSGARWRSSSRRA